MNVNCPRDPLTCKCDYHLGFDDRLNAAFGKPVLDLETYSRLPLPEPWKPTEAQMRTGAGLPGVVESVTREGDTLYGRIRFTEPRAKLLPGVLIDDEPLGVHVAASVWRIVGRWALGFGMVAAGAVVMYAEGQRQPQPGVGFAIGLTLIVGAALLVARGRDDG